LRILSHPDRVMLQWCPATGEDIPTPNTNEIVMFSSFFQRGIGLPACDFLRGLLDHYQIELFHLNPNSMKPSLESLQTSHYSKAIFP
jgi:hypothetical protein